ncbi:MAG: cytochrome c-type biogenesis CcmF C-terminal domain-containing protein, partial [Burkholderiaceae bacterium]|nr:cytochrome c-type biogenesis CcmF C-terminal domain-containing protein [Burkholderiaceae bacterium]
TTTAGGYTFLLTGLQQIKGANYVAEQGTFEVTYGDTKIATMHPQKRLYTVKNMPMTESAIERGFTRDLYISMGEAGNDGAWIVRVQHKPFIAWIWIGSLIMALGGFLAASDRRYRMTSRKQKLATPEAVGVQPITAAT